ncbi:histone deacetylase family protein [Acuticoccus mangrovi]|uniref:Histone deacetylase family protein n=1 Tax=Acuticoccus mangrovi TaxID=2796142 RepID=A0A934INX9_9HYPH|nr:histone deacetylase family protein [Acuticoccus mangrovi]MBJ3774894.1 histone deacetylase family protein [Acuticoccus mangrovi]
MTLIFTDPVFALHETPRGHPERPERMAAVDRALATGPLADLPRRSFEPAPYEAIAACHPSSYIDRLEALIPEAGLVAVDADTSVGPHSMIAARLGSGASLAAVDAVMGAETPNAFVAARPPGHHAERTRAMGFCLINHVAIAARHAQAKHGAKRVAIVDFDVHHGNGTQDIFQDDGSVLYVSTHQSPHYPGTGAASERGVGNIVNLPLPAGTDGPHYRAVFEGEVMRAVAAFGPDLVILSAGFDAHAEDPLGDLLLVEDDFVWITRKMMDYAAEHCASRLVSCLEGGYSLGALERSVVAHVTALANA